MIINLHILLMAWSGFSLNSADFWWLFELRYDKLGGALRISMISQMLPMVSSQSLDPVINEVKEICRRHRENELLAILWLFTRNCIQPLASPHNGELLYRFNQY